MAREPDKGRITLLHEIHITSPLERMAKEDYHTEPTPWDGVALLKANNDEKIDSEARGN